MSDVKADTCNCFIDAWECPECKANYPDVKKDGGFDWSDGDGILCDFTCYECGHEYQVVFYAADVM